MHREIIAFLGGMTLVTAASATMAEKSTRQGKNAAISATHPVLGRWHLNLFGGECAEDLEFRADGTRLVTAGAQKLQAAFTIAAEPDEQGFYRLTDTIQRTNDLPDCAGRKPPVGDSAVGYVRFNESKDRMYACRQRDMTSCWGPYVRNTGISAGLVHP